MQTGFALMESGMSSLKNETNVMMKNAMDVAAGGFVYWMVGYGISFGQDSGSNPFCGVGDWFFDPDVEDPASGMKYLNFFFHIGLCSLCTTIVSGAMTERVDFVAFSIFATLNVFTYVFPACWMWAPQGWLRTLGVVDIGGSGGVHIVGGWSALVATLYLGPRTGHTMKRNMVVMGNPINKMMGLFMIWWGYLALASAGTMGVTGTKWHLGAKATVIVMNSSFGGGSAGLLLCYIFWGGHKLDVPKIGQSVLGSLIAIIAGSFLFYTWEAIFIGFIAGLIAFLGIMLFEKYHIDDPCAAFVTHGICGIWGMISVGLFAKTDTFTGSGDDIWNKNPGVFYGGGHLLLVQLLACLVLILWSVTITSILLVIINFLRPFRVSIARELAGADYTEHNILHGGIGVAEIVEILDMYSFNIGTGVDPTGNNAGHMVYMENKYYNDDRRGSRGTLASIFDSEDNIPAVLLELTGLHEDDLADLHEDDLKLPKHSKPPRMAEGFAMGTRVDTY